MLYNPLQKFHCFDQNLRHSMTSPSISIVLQRIALPDGYSWHFPSFDLGSSPPESEFFLVILYRTILALFFSLIIKFNK